MTQKKILIVEDEPDILDTMKFRLESEGYEVVTAVDGMEALYKGREEAPDLIILDIILPKMDGFQVCRDLKGDPKYHQIPIIVVSAKAQAVDQVEGMRCGADEYMTKPFDSDELVKMVKGTLELKSKPK